ncbi:MAG: hypothetical protein LBR56_05290 [Sporomusaceae bacterium]|jgi:hypothetical protein|nr:hypothetical protein [Sporomusaceae bacterium]
MISPINNLNSIVSSLFKLGQNESKVDKTDSKIKAFDDAYIPSAKFAEGLYKKEEPMDVGYTQEEFENHCGYFVEHLFENPANPNEPTGWRTLQYIPPRNSDPKVIKAWIDAVKNLTPEERGQIQSQLDIECRQKYKLDGIIPGEEMERYMAGMGSYQAALSNTIKSLREWMGSGGNKAILAPILKNLEYVLEIFQKQGAN